jgi:hypothetical protein
MKIQICCWIAHFAHYRTVYQVVFTSNCSLFSNNISLSECLGQSTDRTWWKHMDSFCPTFLYFPYSSLFPLHRPLHTSFQPFYLTSILAKSHREKLVQHTPYASVAIPDPWRYCLALHLIYCLPPSHVCSSWHDPSQLILYSWGIFNISVCPPGWFFADKAGGKGGLSDDFNEPPQSHWKSKQDAWMIALVSEIYPTVVICLLWAWDIYCVAHRY